MIKRNRATVQPLDVNSLVYDIKLQCNKKSYGTGVGKPVMRAEQSEKGCSEVIQKKKKMI